ncbi:S41 family peptidase [Flagellimonas onchidii]|uniref:S41 family peptidase n=1 Tax=Flagellimonas onchidii TaxID=2562684 RepID=UPI0010A5ED69|nr:S41 family peptidase [Allomuricauda onchidii]
MKIRIIFSLICAIVHVNLFSQSFESFNHERLFYVSKVWGLVKYYHPNVSKGNFDIDEKLFDFLAETEKTANHDEFIEALENWIDSFGKYGGQIKCNKGSDLYSMDLDWVENPNWKSANGLKKKLYGLAKNCNKEHFYYSIDKRGVVEFKNEKNHIDSVFPNTNHRLLSLFRYWNSIEYFNPHKKLLEIDWDQVLAEMIIPFQKCKNDKEYEILLKKLIAKISDSHASLIVPKREYKFLPAKVEIVDGLPVVTQLYNDSISKIYDLSKGDIIYEINGNDILNLIEARKDFYSASNEKRVVSKALLEILCENQNFANLTIDREGKKLNLKVPKYSRIEFNKLYKRNKTKGWYFVNDDIGYIDLSTINPDELDKAMRKLIKTKSIIIDLRKYPSAIFYNLQTYLITDQLYFAVKSYVDSTKPGKFVSESLKTSPKEKKTKFNGKIVVLVNGNTQSRGEFIAMRLQAKKNVLTIGNQTSGANGEVSKIKFIGGYETWFTCVRYDYPGNIPLYGDGVKVNIELSPNNDDVLSGNDIILEEAINIANKVN